MYGFRWAMGWRGCWGTTERRLMGIWFEAEGRRSLILFVKLLRWCTCFGNLGAALGDPAYAIIINFPSARIFYIQVKFIFLYRRVLNWLPFSAKKPRPARAFRIRFEIHQHSFSALKVEQLKITGEPYKPYKGVRGRSEGDVEWRWWFHNFASIMFELKHSFILSMYRFLTVSVIM